VHSDSHGDADLNKALWDMPNIGVFVKQLELSLLAGASDCAVHSLKDVPTTLPPGLVLTAIPTIDVPRGDVVIMKSSHVGCGVEDLPSGSIIGTCSLRRQA
jgi:hydroxymethylbilane synthase